jgi:hypothetical protein
MSALCHKRTSAVSLDHLVGTAKQRYGDGETGGPWQLVSQTNLLPPPECGPTKRAYRRRITFAAARPFFKKVRTGNGQSTTRSQCIVQ